MPFAPEVEPMRKIWVVTFSRLGEHRGEFFREVAFLSAAAAIPDCIACMQQHGGRETYKEVHFEVAVPHIDRAWNGDKTTVWLEMLTLVQG